LLGIAERDADGNWRLIHAAHSTIPVRHLYRYARLSGTHNLFPDNSLRYMLEQLDTPEFSRPTRVQATPHEDLRGTPAFTALDAAILERHPCGFIYKGRARLASPYRLIHKSGIWCLAAEEKARLKNFSIGLIDKLEVDSTACFTINPAHVKYIDANDDVWYTTETTEVLLRVAREAAHYFSRQQLLPNQQHRTDSDGSLLMTSKINHIDQALPVVRHWLPHVRILRLAAWHDELVAGLNQAVQRWES
jgi:predicted DNA-binding transcriptional regulator YafY